MHSSFIQKQGSFQTFIDGEIENFQDYDITSDGENIQLYLDDNGEQSTFEFKHKDLLDSDVNNMINDMINNKFTKSNENKSLLQTLMHEFPIPIKSSNNNIKEHLLKEFFDNNYCQGKEEDKEDKEDKKEKKGEKKGKKQSKKKKK